LKYTDPDGELVWIPFAIYGAWVMGVKAGIAAERSGWHFWMDGFWKGALVGFATGAIGGSGIAPFGTQWLGTTLWGSLVGTASYAGNIWAMGGKDYSKIWQGALIGGAMGFMASEQFNNMVKGKGFASNDRVLENFRIGKYGVTEGSIWQQDALDYFGFEGRYNPDIKSKRYQSADYWGATNRQTGEISFGNLAFEDFPTLYGTYIKESYSAQKIQGGLTIKKLPNDLQGLGMDTYLEEIHGYIHAYRRQGLFSGHNFPFSGVEFYQNQLSWFGVSYPTYPSCFSWIYKIKRLW
jgi:hypothetical protein